MIQLAWHPVVSPLPQASKEAIFLPPENLQALRLLPWQKTNKRNARETCVVLTRRRRIEDHIYLLDDLSRESVTLLDFDS